MPLSLTDVTMKTNCHGFSFRKPGGKSVAFEVDSAEAAESARRHVEAVIYAATEVWIHGQEWRAELAEHWYPPGLTRSAGRQTED
jgi:hypothetical protein